MRTNSIVAALAASVCVIALATPAEAAQRQFNIPAGSLKTALDAYGRQSGRPIIYWSEEVRRAKSNGYQGSATPEEALQAILADTGFSFSSTPGGAVAIKSGEANAGSAAADHGSAEIVVTGSRIRGAPQASPVITLGRQQIIDAGQANLSDAVRSLPQNFGGGQNPGIALGPNTANPANGNSTGGTAINLRGLGPDATLTLLNGHRLAYDGAQQAIDVSTIPLAALDRIEVVADGASALYGSDAVGGVANIVLRKDYDGVSVTARGGLATDGGDRQQLYSAVAGKRWGSGGFIATYVHQHDSAIRGDQRDYTSTLPDPDWLLPAQTVNGVVVSGHQTVTDSLSFSIDGTFNRRATRQLMTTASLFEDIAGQTTSFSITPSLTAHFGSWEIDAVGSYSRDNSKSYTTLTSLSTGQFIERDGNCLCNTAKLGELTGEGPVFTLPAGAVRLAVGGGYRQNNLVSRNLSTDHALYAERRSGYGYGELFIPLLAPDMGVPLVSKLSATAAFRYEHYDDLGGVTTPKFGLLYAPVRGIDLKASWGRSFKAPLLSQQYLQPYAYLYPLYAVGGTRFPATETALLAIGGGQNLRPERATSWTATIDVQPVAAPRFHALASYFHVDYRDRIIAPVAIQSALSSSLYADFVTYQPSLTQQQAVIDRSSTGLVNFAGVPYDFSTVVALINNYYTNVAAQTIQGVDIQGDYRADLAGSELTLTAQASYLASRQRNAPSAPSNALAGTLFNPPHVRVRTGLIWKNETITASGFLNYTGGISDTRQVPAISGESMATVDLALRWQTSLGPQKQHPLELAIAVQNLADEKPPYLRPSAVYYVPYDSTNYSAVGRLVALEITSRW